MIRNNDYNNNSNQNKKIKKKRFTNNINIQLNKINLHSELNSKRNSGSFYFSGKALYRERFLEIMMEIAKRSILYYFSKYGERNFILK